MKPIRVLAPTLIEEWRSSFHLRGKLRVKNVIRHRMRNVGRVIALSHLVFPIEIEHKFLI